MDSFAEQLLIWFDRHGRKNLPWQRDRIAYSVWVSEIMLQQTQVATVIPFYRRFMQRFPEVSMLAAASQDEVLALWSGLGYYSRARNLHRAAQMVCEKFAGEFPADLEQLQSLPGVGRSTAGAILAQAFGERGVILDGNVKRVLARYAGIREWPGKSAVQQQLWTLADRYTPDTRLAEYTQAIMDLGATLCRRSKPACPACPLRADCVAFNEQSTAEIPARKPRKPLPVRDVSMLVLRNARGEILLERRPPTGIWGGLWSLPECSPEGVDEHLARLPGETSLQAVGAVREHKFTHFCLRYQPMEIHYREQAGRVSESGQVLWYRPGSDMQLGLPAPVRALLQELEQSDFS